MDLSGPTRLQICNHTRKSAMSEIRQTGKRNSIPLGFLLAKHASVRTPLSGSTELALRLTNQFRSVLMDPLGFQVLLEARSKALKTFIVWKTNLIFKPYRNRHPKLYLHINQPLTSKIVLL